MMAEIRQFTAVAEARIEGADTGGFAWDWLEIDILEASGYYDPPQGDSKLFVHYPDELMEQLRELIDKPGRYSISADLWISSDDEDECIISNLAVAATTAEVK